MIKWRKKEITIGTFVETNTKGIYEVLGFYSGKHVTWIIAKSITTQAKTSIRSSNVVKLVEPEELI
jgi:hypothetical protein